jgi:hypothetical protein
MGNQVQDVAVRGASGWLSLVAAPTFAVMALLSALPGPTDMLCASSSPLTGMAVMYGLMSAFHLSPWLRLLAGRGAG